jgi:diphthine synthase
LGKLTFVGLGLGDQGISLAGIRALKEADVAYLEYYTSPYAPRLLPEVEGAVGKNLTIVDRNFVEDGRKILEEASKVNVALAVQGDPMIATTHNDLRVRAISRGIQTLVLHGATIPAAAASASGLHYYKFGATVTYTRVSTTHHEQVYHTLHRNLLEGLHTLLLLEFDTEKEVGASPVSLMEGLLEAERNFKREVVSEELFLVVLSRIGAASQSVRAGAIAELRKEDFSDPPHCVLVPGSLHFTEVEALAALCGIDPKSVRDNTSTIRRTAQVLVPRYVEKAKRAVSTARSSLGKEYADLLENAELYLRDSENFLANHQDELSMLSVGYAEGLVDSLTFTGKLRLDW